MRRAKQHTATAGRMAPALIMLATIALAAGWLLTQRLASALFERELAQAIADLEARGELVVERRAVERGWFSSTGRLRVAPALGSAWQIEFTYLARHGALSTRMEGEARPAVGARPLELFGDWLPSSPPRWYARYRTLGGTLEGSVQLAPFLVSQGEREFDFGGGRVALRGQRGDWQLRARLQPWQLRDGAVTLAVGPASLESRYAYTDGAHHFTQRDLLRLDALAWHQPDLTLAASELVYRSHMQLDDSELRISSELTLGALRAAEQLLLNGRVALELSRIHADAVRGALMALRQASASGQAHELMPRDLLTRLETELLALLVDSPRLDLVEVDLDSPMLGLAARGRGVLLFDPRRLDELTPSRLDTEQEQARWLRRLDGDLIWRDVPAVVALWLGLPLGTRDLEIDVIRGRVRVNGRPLPPLWR